MFSKRLVIHYQVSVGTTCEQIVIVVINWEF